MKNLPESVLRRLKQQGAIDDRKTADGDGPVLPKAPTNEAKIKKHQQNGGNDGFEYCTSCMPKGENE